ncbi:MAG: hypothetical protein JSS87_08140 [Acidobacteria bacterium]|nr:hypothetical protein [Acidobacteriota bacterium]
MDIPDAEYEQAKIVAARNGTSIKEIVRHGLKLALAEMSKPRRRKLQRPPLKSKNPGSVHLTNEMIYDLIEFP